MIVGAMRAARIRWRRNCAPPAWRSSPTIPPDDGVGAVGTARCTGYSQPRSGKFLVRPPRGLRAAGSGRRSARAGRGQARVERRMEHSSPAICPRTSPLWASAAASGPAGSDRFGQVPSASERSSASARTSAQDLCDGIAEGFDQIETLKRYTTATMGPCQGRMCQLGRYRRLRARDRPEHGRHRNDTSRPPHPSVTLGALAGPRHHPIRRTPCTMRTRHWARSGSTWESGSGRDIIRRPASAGRARLRRRGVSGRARARRVSSTSARWAS